MKHIVMARKIGRFGSTWSIYRLWGLWAGKMADPKVVPKVLGWLHPFRLVSENGGYPPSCHLHDNDDQQCFSWVKPCHVLEIKANCFSR